MNSEGIITSEETGSKPESLNQKKKRNEYKEKECKVIKYNKNNRTLDILYDTYGIRLSDVNFYAGETVTIKYKGEIGLPNFKIIV